VKHNFIIFSHENFCHDVNADIMQTQSYILYTVSNFLVEMVVSALLINEIQRL